MTALLDMFLNHGVEVQANLLKKRQQDQGFASSSRSFHLSVTKIGFVAA